jgi:hypothetical protein
MRLDTSAAERGAKAFFIAWAVPLAALTAGCMHRAVVAAIPHPMTTGQLDATMIQHEYPSVESGRGLPPGALSDSASITRMDAEAICFDVHLRQIDEGNGEIWTVLDNWSIGVLSDDVAIGDGTAQTDDQVAQVYQGLNPVEVQTGQQRVCTQTNAQGRCTRSQTQPITETQMLPGPVTVVTGGGTICFPNQGRVTPATQRLRLQMRIRSRTRDFEWQLVP